MHTVESCEFCDSGYAPNADKNGCEICPASTYSVAGDSSCTQCIASEGKVSKTSGSTRCEFCGPGYRADAETNSCVACVPSKYSLGGGDRCIDCGDNEISPSNATSCRGCNPGSVPIENVCTPCLSSMFARFGETSCSECNQPGEYSDAMGSAFCSLALPGFIPNIDRTGALECPVNTFSVGATDNCTKCDGGHSEPPPLLVHGGNVCVRSCSR